MTAKSTKDRILAIARDILTSQGLTAVSFDAIAHRLDITKQAVLYWYPTKHDLLAAMFLPWLNAEAEAAAKSVADTATRDEAIAALVKAVIAFHLDDLDRFRMMYLLPQTIRPSTGETHASALLTKVHAVTDTMYSAIADKLDGAPYAARREAFAVHSAALGLVMIFGLADSIKDPLKHTESEAVEALVKSLQSQRRM